MNDLIPEDFSILIETKWNEWTDYLREIHHPILDKQYEEEQISKLFDISASDIHLAGAIIDRLIIGNHNCI